MISGNRILIFLVTISFLLSMSGYVEHVAALGHISYQFEIGTCLNPDSVRINSNVVATVYTGPGGDGFVKTLGVLSNGTVSSTIDTWEFNTSDAVTCKIATSGLYVYIFYRSPNGDSWVIRFTVYSNGAIHKTIDKSYHVTNHVINRNIRCQSLSIAPDGKVMFSFTLDPLGASKAFIQFMLCDSDLSPLFSQQCWWDNNIQNKNTSCVNYVYDGGNYELFMVNVLCEISIGSLSVNRTLIKINNDDMGDFTLAWHNFSTAETPGICDAFYVLEMYDNEFSKIYVLVFTPFPNENFIFTFEVFKSGYLDDDSYLGILSHGGTKLIAGLFKLNNTRIGVFVWFSSNHLGLYNYTVSAAGLITYNTLYTTTAFYTLSSSIYVNTVRTHDGCYAIVTESLNTGYVASLTDIYTSYDFAAEEQTITPTVSYCGYDMSIYSSVKQDNLEGYDIYTSQYKYIEDKYSVFLTTNIAGVGVLIGNDQYTADSNLNNYIMQINDKGTSIATCIFQYDTTSYMVFWKTDISLNREYAVFEFLHTVAIPGFYNTYWQLCGNLDTSTSGLTFPKYHSSDNLFDGIYNGELFPVVPPGHLHGLEMIFWYGDITIQNESSPYIDMITVPKLSYLTFENVQVYWQVANTTYSYQIQAWHNGTQIIEYLWPYDVPVGKFSGLNSYVPLHIGNYQFQLLYNSVRIKSVNITVSEGNRDFAMWVSPNPGVFGEFFRIGYRYYPSDGMPGLVTLDTSLTTNISDVQKYWVISPNTSGNLTYVSFGNYWIQMFKKSGSTYHSIAEVPPIYFTIQTLFGNEINVEHPTFQIAPDSSFTQTFYGSHMYYGNTVYIYLNNGLIGSVGSTPIYRITKEIYDAIEYSVELSLLTANGTIILASTNFIVSLPETLPPSQDAWAFLGEYKSIFAIGFIMMFLFIPAVISSRLGIDMPLLAYIGTGSMGVAFCSVTELVPVYFVFFIVVALVSSAVIIMFR